MCYFLAFCPSGINALCYFCIIPENSIVAKIKDFFEMKRHERRGSIVVMAIIALILVATCYVRSCRGGDSTLSSVDIRQFEAEADTTTITHPKPEHKKPAAAPKKRRHSSPKPSKPAPAPRRLDPVPNF